jgi:hypothetical protein
MRQGHRESRSRPSFSISIHRPKCERQRMPEGEFKLAARAKKGEQIEMSAKINPDVARDLACDDLMRLSTFAMK